MFEKFTPDVIAQSDFFQYFRDSCFRLTKEFLEITGIDDNPVGKVGYLGSSDYFYIYDFNGSPDSLIASPVATEHELSRTGREYLASNPQLFNYPKIGYAPCTSSGHVLFVHVSPSDAARRGFTSSRVRGRMNVDTLFLHSAKNRRSIIPNLHSSTLFISLIGDPSVTGLSFSRFTEFKDGVEQMFEGGRYGFVVNPKTCVTLNTDRDCTTYPLRIWYNQAVVGYVDAQKNVVSTSSKIDLSSSTLLKKAA